MHEFTVSFVPYTILVRYIWRHWCSMWSHHCLTQSLLRLSTLFLLLYRYQHIMSSLESLSQSWADDCLPPEGVFPSREVLYEAINKWALPRNYAFVVGRSRKDPANGRCTVTYACDRGCKPPDPSDKRKRKTSTRGTECSFSIIAKEARDSSWQLKHRDPKYHQHNHEPSLHPLAHPAHRKMAAQEKTCIL